MTLKGKITLLIVVAVLALLFGGFGSLYDKAGRVFPAVFQPPSDRAQNIQGAEVPDYEKSVCSDAPERYKCLAEYYERITMQRGAGQASADMKQRSTEDSFVLSQCHQLMHVVGRKAADAFPTISEAFAAGDSFCWSGYYHGVMERMIDKTPSQKLHSEMDNICADIPGKENYTFDYYNCVHGLGHGVYAYYEGELPSALSMCDNLTGRWEQESCYGGVFMQNIIDSTFTHGTGYAAKYLRAEEPLYPCTEVEKRFKGQCYLGQTSYALTVNGFDFKKVFELCKGVEQPYRDICNQSMGRDVANQAGHEKVRTKELCGLAPTEEDRKNCIIGAVKEIISYYHSDKEAYEFCEILSSDDQTFCRSTTQGYYSYF